MGQDIEIAREQANVLLSKMGVDEAGVIDIHGFADIANAFLAGVGATSDGDIGFPDDGRAYTDEVGSLPHMFCTVPRSFLGVLPALCSVQRVVYAHRQKAPTGCS